MKKYLGFLLLLMVVKVNAQQTNATAGVDATGSTGSASITIGQQDYINYSSASGYSNEGVQHPYELFGGATNTWTGATSTDWNDASNWSGGTVPTSIASITIPSNPSKQPVLSGDIVVGNVSLLGSLSLNGHTLTINGAVSGSGYLKGSAASSLVIGGTAGTLSFDPSANNLKNLTITGSATLGNALNVYGIFAPTSGSLNTGDFLTLKSTSINTSAVVDVVGGAVTGKVTVERFIPQGLRTYRDLGAGGVANAGSLFANWQEGGINNNGYGIQITGVKNTVNGTDPTTGLDYNGTGNHSAFTCINNIWDTILTTKGTILDPYQGFRVLVRGNRTINILIQQPPMLSPATIRATGDLITGDVTFGASGVTGNYPSSYSLTNVARAYTFIANPYASVVDWEAVYNNSQNMNASYWYSDPTITNNGTGNGYTNFVSYNAISHSLSNPLGQSRANRYLQPGQAFFVENGANGTPQLEFKESHKAANQAKTAIFGTATVNRIAIGLYSNKVNLDGAVSVFGSNFSKSISKEDAIKFSNAGENIAFTVAGKDLSINGYPMPSITDVLPIHLYNLQPSTDYTIRLDASQFSSGGVNAFVKDNVSNTQTLLSGDSTVLSFATNVLDAASYANRYSIVFGASALPVSNINLTTTALQGKQVAIRWAVTGEKNILGYMVERSTNGSDFSELASVSPSTSHNYSYIDAFSSNFEGVYYRIKATDNAGKVSYSNVSYLTTTNSQLTTISVYPNPVTGKSLRVDLGKAATGKYSIVIYNKLGQQVYSSSINHNEANIESINLDKKLATGSYTLSFVGNNQTLKTEIEVK